jgi:hypothetical protein
VGGGCVVWEGVCGGYGCGVCVYVWLLDGGVERKVMLGFDTFSMLGSETV